MGSVSSGGAGGAVAAGHPATADAAAEILTDGGNAFDAVLAGMCAACVAEPVLASLGGGGFLTARQADGSASVFDFFVQTPGRRRPAADIDFSPIVADFGTATQEFHIGRGAMAVPGTVAGLFAAHAALGRLPMARLVEPAARLAREGVTVNRLQAFIFDVVSAIYLATEDCARQYGRPGAPGTLVGEGDLLRVPALADTFEALAREGADLFYKGEVAEHIERDCRTGGGLLRRADLAGYRVERRAPLRIRHGGAEMDSNPPPSSGGLLIAFGLEVLSGTGFAGDGFGAAAHLGALVRTLAATSRVRRDGGLERGGDTARRLLAPDLIARYRTEVASHPPAGRGTTHISVVDGAGNAAALTLSNGEGAGYIVPGTGIVMNNMLGEEDINPHGLHRWPENSRMSSMMAPTVLVGDDGRLAALGSGGSNRIRTAILQVLLGLIDFGLPAVDAVALPRLHLEGGTLGLEPGFAEAEAAIAAAGPDVEVHRWPEANLFFGGVHVAERRAGGAGFAAVGDPRRGGVGRIISR